MKFLHNMLTYIFQMLMIQFWGSKFAKNMVWNVDNQQKKNLKMKKLNPGMEFFGKNFVLTFRESTFKQELITDKNLELLEGWNFKILILELTYWKELLGKHFLELTYPKVP